jgi:hypothetical protein
MRDRKTFHQFHLIHSINSIQGTEKHYKWTNYRTDIIIPSIVIQNHYQDRQNQHSKFVITGWGECTLTGQNQLLQFYILKVEDTITREQLTVKRSRWWWRLKRRVMLSVAIDEEEVVSCWWWKRKEIVASLPLLMKIEEEAVSCWGNHRRCWWKGSCDREHWWLEWRKRRSEDWTVTVTVTVIVAAFVVAGWLIREGD